MIQIMTGDLLGADADALVNPVNSVGVMGRGLALQFKPAHPDNFTAYATACRRGQVRPGQMFVFERTGQSKARYLINFPTKRHGRMRSSIVDIDSGLEALVETLAKRPIRSVAVPPLGCGLGGLAWSRVRPRIIDALGTLPGLDVFLYAPSPQHPGARTGHPPDDRPVHR